MPDYYALRSPEVLNITDSSGNISFGATQDWYSTRWKQRAGCGPTNCSHLLWYLSQTRPGCEALSPYDGSAQMGFSRLMEDVWNYVTPGKMGTDSTAVFTDGAIRYGHAHNVPLSCRALNVPSKTSRRPDVEELKAFLTDSFRQDTPVAFLNLSNGELSALDSWHWVTLAAFSPGGMTAVMYDQGKKQEIDLSLWLGTSALGGGFVTLDKAG